jgi:hypothetical protein
VTREEAIAIDRRDVEHVHNWAIDRAVQKLETMVDDRRRGMKRLREMSPKRPVEQKVVDVLCAAIAELNAMKAR